ncbi:SAM-dependent methyltransferase [Actinomadura soli]|uniref:SAM-dependent methyltransferase n=1 Tax=Actinomadura soli TaxID=2508997 RepID=A0A5C4J2I8_9ACTN|nr:SAM-dependent methyltransferase [Actinomadura soli]TMQ90988.1 SAM-dependent methyltransferase [Actinomadura soli]
MSAHDTAVDCSAVTGDPIELDTSTPVMARVWNVWSSGKDGGPVEQQFGAQVEQRYPQIVDVARFRLIFRALAVRAMVEEYGLRQLLVIGVDVPLRDEVHDIAQRIDPLTRVVYADTDLWVMTHARALLTSSAPGGCAHVDADLHDPGALLDQVAATLTLAEPVGVLLINSLDAVDDPTAAHTLAVLRTALPGGSCLAICHLGGNTGRGLTALGALRDRPIPGLPHARTLDGIQALFTDLDLAEPGLVTAPHWRPEPSPWAPLDGVDLWCGVGRVPDRAGAR